jgi:hypothetical protein
MRSPDADPEPPKILGSEMLDYGFYAVCPALPLFAGKLVGSASMSESSVHHENFIGADAEMFHCRTTACPIRS